MAKEKANKNDKNKVKANKEISKNKKSFFKSFKTELKKVVWPTPKQLANNTFAVIAIVLITVIIVFVLDLAFNSINKFGVEKLKETISNTTSTTENTTATNDVANETDSNSTTVDNNQTNTSEAENVVSESNESVNEVVSENQTN